MVSFVCFAAVTKKKHAGFKMTTLLEKRVKNIDQELSNEGVLVHQRPLKALDKYSKKFKKNQNIYFTDENIEYKFIKDWYKKHYGNKVNLQNPSKYTIIIKNNPYEFKPTISFGSIKITPEFLLKRTKDLTISTFESLNENELNEIVNFIVKIFYINNFLLDNEKHIILSDLTISTDCLVNLHNYKMVEWQCLQAAEKLIKDYLIIKGINDNPPRTHNLDSLFNLTNIQNENLVNLLNIIQTSPSVRYEENGDILCSINKYKSTILFIREFIDYY